MKLIKEKLIDSVQEETGIKLTSKDFQIQADLGVLKIILWGEELLSMEYDEDQLEDDDFAEEVVQELFREHYDLRGKIVEMKLDDLNNNHLPSISENILDKLEEAKVDERLLDVLDFEFIDQGYIQGNFTSPGEEEFDYPDLALRVTDFEDLEHFIEIDPYKNPSDLDIGVISNQIILKIRGKI
jgi:hypothetical protein